MHSRQKHIIIAQTVLDDVQIEGGGVVWSVARLFCRFVGDS